MDHSSPLEQHARRDTRLPPAVLGVARRAAARMATTILALSLAAPALGQTPAASKTPSPSLRAADILALGERFARFSDALPDASQLGVDGILAFEENKLFVYVLGVAPNTPPTPEGPDAGDDAPLLVRRVIFLKPSTFVVDDQVRGADPGQPLRWVLHSRTAPDVRGRKIRIAEGGAEILCETLLPKDAALKSRPWPSGGQKPTGHVVEVAAPPEVGGSLFIHVLHTRSAAGTSTARSELVLKESLFQLKVLSGDRAFQLTLPSGRAATGTIAVSKADGQTLLAQRLLPSGILPHGAKGVRLLERWDGAYRGRRRAPWDTGRPSSNLKKAIEDGAIRPCRAVVLGCGTGTNAVYLASKGFDVTALDIAPTALTLGQEKARKAAVRVLWVVADVLAPPRLGKFDFIFDRGCYHGVRRQNAAGYVETVRRLSRVGTRFLLLAGNANEARRYGPPRVKEEELRADFSSAFDFQWLREARFDTKDPKRKGALAWSALLRRKEEPKAKDDER